MSPPSSELNSKPGKKKPARSRKQEKIDALFDPEGVCDMFLRNFG
jgi:hypothetical protein